MSRALVMSDYADPDSEIERLRGVVEAAKRLVEEWRRVAEALDSLDFPECPRPPADEKLIVAVAALAALERRKP